QQVQGQQLNITINDELRTYVDPLTPAEHEALERSLLAEGCREALILWRDVLIDGHNRYAICTQHGIPFRTVQNDKFESIEDVKLWMIDNQLARRSVSDFQRGLMAIRKKDIMAARAAQKKDAELETEEELSAGFTPPWAPQADGGNVRGGRGGKRRGWQGRRGERGGGKGRTWRRARSWGRGRAGTANRWASRKSSNRTSLDSKVESGDEHRNE